MRRMDFESINGMIEGYFADKIVPPIADTAL